jgi:hypothetical protein
LFHNKRGLDEGLIPGGCKMSTFVSNEHELGREEGSGEEQTLNGSQPSEKIAGNVGYSKLWYDAFL